MSKLTDSTLRQAAPPHKPVSVVINSTLVRAGLASPFISASEHVFVVRVDKGFSK